MKIHPAAEILPMQDEASLTSLAESIKRQGLLVPLVLDKNGVLLDGRNRLKACEMAGVEPMFVTHEGDAVDYIEDVQAERRDLTKGQKAMFRAMVRPNGQQGKRTSGFNPDVDLSYIGKARFVCRHMPELAKQVLSGAPTLAEAYATAKAAEAEAAKPKDALGMLELRYADLAGAVRDEEMTLDRAVQQAGERDELVESKRRAWSDIIRTTISISKAMAHPATLEEIRSAIRDDDKTRGELAPFFKGQDAEFLRDTMEHAMANLLLIWGDLQRKAK